MNTSGPDLLRRLSGGVTPAGTPHRERAGTGSSLRFDTELVLAAAAQTRSGLPVRIPAALRAGVSDADRLVLSDAADRASAEGIDHALVLLGDRAFRLDVTGRAVTDAPAAQETVISGIDGVIRPGAERGAEPADSSPLGPARVVRNSSLIDSLSRDERAGA